MRFTTCFGLHSQTTRLCESASCSGCGRAYGVLTLSDAPFQGTWARPAAEVASLDYNSPRGSEEISKLGSSRFARRY